MKVKIMVNISYEDKIESTDWEWGGRQFKNKEEFLTFLNEFFNTGDGSAHITDFLGDHIVSVKIEEIK